MRSQHTSDYPTLREVLRLPAFAGCVIRGGAAGAERRVSGVNLTDTPDYARWLAPGELLITTGFAIAADPQAVGALLPTAAEKGLCGVGIKPGRYLPKPLPEELTAAADRLALPLIQLPDDVRFSELADAVSREIARRRIPAEQERHLASLLHHLISGTPGDETTEQAAACGIHLAYAHIILRIRADAPELQRRAWLHEAEERCQMLGVNVWGALPEKNILLLLETKDDPFPLEMPLRQAMTELAAVHGFSCGISRPYSGAEGFQKADHSARRALCMAERTETLCVTDDPAGVIRLLETGTSPAETDLYIDRQLGPILQQQELRRKELLDTLDSWLRCMGNQRRMARELHLHYNTVSYRLQLLWTLLGTDPADPVKRLALETALYLYRYRRA